MKVITYIDPLSTAKIAAILGILWSVLGWLFSGIVISVFVIGAPEEVLTDLPQSFSLGGLLSGVIGGVIGGGVSGFLGSLMYNALAIRLGGVAVEITDDMEQPPLPPSPTPDSPLPPPPPQEQPQQ